MRPHVFEVIVPHVFHGEHVDVGVGGCAGLDVGVEGGFEVAAFLAGLGQMDDFGALRFGHFVRIG